ncbi:choice-of-anchor Q domain-containing protein [Arenicella xantha]|uniref:Putative outer membrane repeat protein n=1 Tax=Arenicella xantha TaxID=644221 RepID=A0A395JJU7_9GAMM|nr:choice-of-anchor Q domain-containing protein [Arenicella xantha]RBP51056.1 putative outer membrane repeat protein [Arenicella xantha]
MKNKIILSLGLLLAANYSQQSEAATLQVCTSGCQYQTIAGAVFAASAGDQIYVRNGTYLEHDIVIDKRLTIVGESQQNTIVDATEDGRHFNILESADSVGLQDLTLTNGNSLVAPLCGSSAYREGGSLCALAVHLKIWQVSFVRNTAGRYGGAIYLAGRDNSSLSAYSNLLIGKSEFSQNKVLSSLPINNDGGGGAIACGYCDGIEIFRNTFDQNKAQPVGSGTSWSGGAIFAWQTNNISANQNTYTGNSAVGEGGAIALSTFGSPSLHAKLTNETFFKNNAELAGGALYDIGTNILDIRRSTFYGNSATEGGALSVESLSVDNSTFSQNSALQQGSAIEFRSAYDLAGIANSTFFANHSKDRANGSVLSFHTLLNTGDKVISNSIFSKNTGVECDFNGANGFIVGEHNLTDTLSCDPNNGANSGPYGFALPFSLGSVSGLDSNLSNNGGFTQTHAISSASNAVDSGANNCVSAISGSPLSRDQRGYVRVLNRCDIGAYEVQ